jgi:hypothetical protein
MERPSYINGADEVLVASHKVCERETENDGEEPRAEESFPGFLGGNFDQWRAAKSDTTDVCEDVVRYDHGDRQEEPDHAFENVVDDKVRLTDDQE